MSKNNVIKFRNPFGQKVSFDMTTRMISKDMIGYEYIFTDHTHHMPETAHKLIKTAMKEYPEEFDSVPENDSYEECIEKTRVVSQLVKGPGESEYYHLPNVMKLSAEEFPWTSGNLMAFNEDDAQVIYELVTHDMVDAIIRDEENGKPFYRLIKDITCDPYYKDSHKELVRLFKTLKLVWEIRIDGKPVLDNKGRHIVFDDYKAAFEYARITTLYVYSCLMPEDAVYEVMTVDDEYDDMFGGNLLYADKEIYQNLKDLIVPTNLSEEFIEYLRKVIEKCIEQHTPMYIPEPEGKYPITIAAKLVPNNGIAL